MTARAFLWGMLTGIILCSMLYLELWGIASRFAGGQGYCVCVGIVGKAALTQDSTAIEGQYKASLPLRDPSHVASSSRH